MEMKKQGRTDLFLILCGILIWFLADAARIRARAAEALALCAGAVIPALFPFLAVSGLLVSLGFGAWLSPCLRGLMGPLFRLPGQAAGALVLGLVGGYPIGARTAAELYRQGELTRSEAQRLLAFCNNSNPVFLVSVLGAGVFHSVRTGVWLWLIHLLSALLTGLCFRGRGTAERRRQQPPRLTCRAVSFSSAMVDAVRNAAGGMLSICAFVVLFSVLAAPLQDLGPHAGPALTGLLELFSLTPLLSPDRFGFLLAAGCAGWGGCSVLCQTAAVLADTDLSLRPCLLGKLLQGLFSLLLAAAVWQWVL